MPKNKVKGQNKNFSKVNYLIRTNRITNIFLRSKRQLRTSNKLGGSNGSNLVKVFFENLFLTFKLKGNLFKKLVLVSLIIIFFATAYTHFAQYNKISFDRYLSKGETQNNLDGVQYNILLTGFNKFDNNRFVEILILVSSNAKTGIINTISINPSYIVSAQGKKYTLRSLWNNIEDKERRMDIYSSAVSEMLGVRVDGYIAFENDKLASLIEDWGLEMKTIDAFNSSSEFYQEGSLIKGKDLAEYLTGPTREPTDDIHTKRSLSFFNYFIERYRDLLFYYKVFWEFEKVNSTFFTNLPKDRMLSFANSIMNSSLPFKSLVIGNSLAFAGNTGVEEGLTPNYIEMDEAIVRTIGDLDIIREQAKIEIYNASNQGGLANKVKRVFENIGSNVINTSNYPELKEEVIVYIPKKDPQNYPYNLAAINRYFKNEVNLILGEYKYNYSGDIIIVIGKVQD